MKHLIEPKICSCGIEHKFIPENARWGADYKLWFWECDCKSNLTVTTAMIDDEVCDCKDCAQSENPCHQDCDDEKCRGCVENMNDALDKGFIIDRAMGRR